MRFGTMPRFEAYLLSGLSLQNVTQVLTNGDFGLIAPPQTVLKARRSEAGVASTQMGLAPNALDWDLWQNTRVVKAA